MHMVDDRCKINTVDENNCLSTRAEGKHANRDHDEYLLDHKLINRDDLRKINGFFSALPLNQFYISAIGGRPLKKNTQKDFKE